MAETAVNQIPPVQLEAGDMAFRGQCMSGRPQRTPDGCGHGLGCVCKRKRTSPVSQCDIRRAAVVPSERPKVAGRTPDLLYHNPDGADQLTTNGELENQIDWRA